jgi:multidrug efflux pump subunit AcrA (membrane-fusion protein)
MPGRTRLLLWSAFTAIGLGVISGCSKTEKAPEAIVTVQVAAVKESSIERVISSDAVLFPLHQAAITPKVSAPVGRFYVNRGDRVKAGQLLATLENRDLAASEVENKGALAQAEAAYATTTASGLPEEMRKSELDAEAAKQALDAEQKLYESRENLFKQGALPRKDLDQARVNLTQAKSQYEMAQQHWNALQAGGKEQALKAASGQLESARGKYLGSQAQLHYSEIRSPINGFITERAVYPGEIAAAGTPLLVVMDTSAVIAKAHIPQQDAALLKVGDSAEIAAEGVDHKIPARITVVSPATDPNSTTVEIWAQASNTGNHLRPGTTVHLSIAAQKRQKTLVIPSSAILNQADGSNAVMVLGQDNRAHLQGVQIGIQSGEESEVSSGLKAGQQIVTSGNYGLPDNTQVKVEASTKPETTKSD